MAQSLAHTKWMRKYHIHLLVLISPKESISSFMGYLKDKSVIMIFDGHLNFD